MSSVSPSANREADRLIDWDDALDNIGHVSGADRLPERWAEAARRFREQPGDDVTVEPDRIYGPGPRHRLDMFRCGQRPNGLVVFVHGGYWTRLGKDFVSHFAAGALAAGFDVAIPGYTLAPDARISGITSEVGLAIAAAARESEGPVTLVGHSAGGHLVTRMICDDSPLPGFVRERLARVVSVSGIYDLRPLILTGMNAALNLDAAEARSESPVFRSPDADLAPVSLALWVGSRERPEFLRQTQLMVEAWQALRPLDLRHMGDRDHFSVIEDLAIPETPLTRAVTGAAEWQNPDPGAGQN